MGKEMKHTSGPWEIVDGVVHVPHKTTHSGGCIYHTAQLSRRIGTMSGVENNANARLIAAAPELLAQLEVMVERMERTGRDTANSLDLRLAKKARAVIAKARGEA